MTTLPRCIVRKSGQRARRAPLLFVHGAFTGAWCWDEYFLPYFAARGHDAWAVDLRGHGEHAEPSDFASLDDYVADVLLAIERLGEPPVIIGHSMGAIVVQRALRRAKVRAVGLLAPVPPQGLLGSSFLLAAKNPEILNEINKLQLSEALPAAPGLLRQAIFSPHLPAAEVHRHLRRMRSESQRALFDLSWPQHFWLERATVPVQVFGAQDDLFFPPHAVEETARLHGVAAEIIPDLAHAMMLDANWERAAERLAAWLALHHA
jgi:non-heme chloroperoxidase